MVWEICWSRAYWAKYANDMQIRPISLINLGIQCWKSNPIENSYYFNSIPNISIIALMVWEIHAGHELIGPNMQIICKLGQLAQLTVVFGAGNLIRSRTRTTSNSIPNFVIVAHTVWCVCCSQANVHRRTDGRTDGRTDVSGGKKSLPQNVRNVPKCVNMP